MFILPPCNFKNPASLITVSFAIILSKILEEKWIIGETTIGNKKINETPFDLKNIFETLKTNPVILKDSETLEEFYNLNKNLFFIKTEKIYVCGCGKVEIPFDILHKKRNNPFSLIKNDSCLVCRNKLILKNNEPSLYINFPKIDYSFLKVNPIYAQKEFQKKVLQFNGSNKRISRFRNTGILFKFKNMYFQIDPDVSILSFLIYISRSFKNVKIITGRRSLEIFGQTIRFCKNINNLKMFFVPFCQNFKTLYPQIEKLNFSLEKIFFLISVSLSWKKNSFAITENDIIKIAKLNNDYLNTCLFSVLRKFSKHDDFIYKLNKNLLNLIKNER